MASPTKPKVPVWTVQVACLSQSLCLVLLTGAIVVGKDVPTTTFLGLAALCTLDRGLLLGVPTRVLPAIVSAAGGLIGKRG